MFFFFVYQKLWIDHIRLKKSNDDVEKTKKPAVEQQKPKDT
jgi:hypothetical protein